jgi:hypothetical protein
MANQTIDSHSARTIRYAVGLVPNGTARWVQWAAQSKSVTIQLDSYLRVR